MNPTPITFGDKVRIRSTNATEVLGIAGKTGVVCGTTTPSVTGVDVIGISAEDLAIAVNVDGRSEALWFAQDLLEFVDHQLGTMVKIEGRRLIRGAQGEWHEIKRQ
jgi:hypothetical protein